MVTMELIQKLREITGLGIMDCKNALIESNGNIEAAVEALRKKGLAVSQKRSSNKTAAGIIHSYIHAGSQVGVMVQINTETDFVARNDLIKSLAHDICMQIAVTKPQYVAMCDIDASIIEKEKNIFYEQMVNEKKPKNIIDSIVEGKVKRVFSEQCLMEQNFIKNESITIQQYLNEVIAKVGESVKIVRFIRYEV